MAYERKPNLAIENARITSRNFSGKERRNPRDGRIVNPEGDRGFCVDIPNSELAFHLREEGWNVKTRVPRDEYDEPTYYIPVKVRFDRWPPEVYCIVGNRKKELTEDTISCLDDVVIIDADVEIRPSYYDVNDRKGISAYLRTLYVTIEENRFAKKYEKYDDSVPFE